MEDLARMVVYILGFLSLLGLISSYIAVRLTKDLGWIYRIAVMGFVGFLPWFLPRGLCVIPFGFYIFGIILFLIIEKIKE